jgi:hypothetical protein
MKLEVTQSGCYWRVDGAMTELKVGAVIDADEIPAAFEGRVVVVGNQDREFEVNTPQKESQPRQPK